MRAVLHAFIRRMEKMMGVPSPYLHFILDHSLQAFLNFAFFLKMANQRERLPKEAWHLARILATQHVDCGTCVQITVNLALKDGVDGTVIRKVLAGEWQELKEEARDLCEFTLHILRHSYEEGPLREKLLGRYGEKGLIDLAYAIASAQVFPYTKKVLGYAMSCSKVQVEIN